RIENRHGAANGALLAEAWPEAVPFEELRRAARRRLGGGEPAEADAARDREQVGQAVLRCYTASLGLAELHVDPARLTRRVSERPRATPLARWQAGAGAKVTNLRHEVVMLGDFERHVLRRLDGGHDRAALVEALAEVVRQGELTVQEGGAAVPPGD